jgi:cytochrome c biogenesis protein CcmG, thiol:disulfide interchange protein DsbE
MAKNPTKQPVVPPPASRSKVPLMVLGAAVVVAAAIALIVGSGSSKKQSTTSTETSTITVTGTALARLPDSGADPAKGKPIPDISGSKFDGSTQSITKDGRAKVIMFVAHWCPHCQREVPVITQWLKAGNGSPDVDLYAVATATSSDQPNYPPSSWLQKVGWPVPTIADSTKNDAANAFGLTAYPFFVVVDHNGNVVVRQSGELTTAQLAQLLAQAKA